MQSMQNHIRPKIFEYYRFIHWVGLIIPNDQFYLKLTTRLMTKWFKKSTYKTLDKDRKLSIVISWTDKTSLNKFWPCILNYATDLQDKLDQPYIKVIRDGDEILVRRWR